jgi:hypothetical protein
MRSRACLPASEARLGGVRHLANPDGIGPPATRRRPGLPPKLVPGDCAVRGGKVGGWHRRRSTGWRGACVAPDSRYVGAGRGLSGGSRDGALAEREPVAEPEGVLDLGLRQRGAVAVFQFELVMSP